MEKKNPYERPSLSDTTPFFGLVWLLGSGLLWQFHGVAQIKTHYYYLPTVPRRLGLADHPLSLQAPEVGRNKQTASWPWGGEEAVETPREGEGVGVLILVYQIVQVAFMVAEVSLLFFLHNTGSMAFEV